MHAAAVFWWRFIKPSPTIMGLIAECDPAALDSPENEGPKQAPAETHNRRPCPTGTNGGSLQWKYLLARCERYVCVNGQLESSWPVYGVCFSDSEPRGVIASAGGHVELPGGVIVAALDPPTGEVPWKKRLVKLPSKVPPGGRGAQIVGHSFINSVPRVADGRIVFGDGGRKGGQFIFRPGDSEEELNHRLARPPEKKR